MLGRPKKKKKSYSYRTLLTCVVATAILVISFQFYLIFGARSRQQEQKQKENVKATKIKNIQAVLGRKGKNKSNGDTQANNAGETSTANEDDVIQNLITFAQGGTPPDEETLQDLPTGSDYAALYGSEIVIHGLETCENFRNTVKEFTRHIGPAGIFNTGTNYLMNMLRNNCLLPNNSSPKGVRFQVPWGKHSPAYFRLNNIAAIDGKGIIQTDVLPVVTIKDPYTWMTSMCRHPYTSSWPHSEELCPNLVTSSGAAIPLKVRYGPDKLLPYDSLLDLWNKYYRDYFDVTEYPRLIVRYEDFLIRPIHVMTQICGCAGGFLKDIKKIQLKTESAKGTYGVHKGAQGLVSALKKYGNAALRESEISNPDDVHFAKKNLDSELMAEFHYQYIE